MAKDKHAGRKSKYREETVLLSNRNVPKSQLQNVKNLIDEFLKPFEVGYVPNENDPIIALRYPSKPETVTVEVGFKKQFEEKKCGCYLDNGIMKRGKEKPACKLLKEQHKF